MVLVVVDEEVEGEEGLERDDYDGDGNDVDMFLPTHTSI